MGRDNVHAGFNKAHKSLQNEDRNSSMAFKPIDMLHLRTSQNINFEVLEAMSSEVRENAFKRYVEFHLRNGAKVFLKRRVGRGGKVFNRIELNPSDFSGWQACEQLLREIIETRNTSELVVVRLDLNVDLQVDPQTLRLDFDPGRFRKLVRISSASRDGRWEGESASFSLLSRVIGAGRTIRESEALYSGSQRTKQIVIYSPRAKARLQGSATTSEPLVRIEARYLSSSSIKNGMRRLAGLIDFLPLLAPFRQVKLYRIADSVPIKPRERAIYDLYRLLRTYEGGHAAAVRKIRSYDPVNFHRQKKMLSRLYVEHVPVDLNGQFRLAVAAFLSEPIGVVDHAMLDFGKKAARVDHRLLSQPGAACGLESELHVH